MRFPPEATTSRVSFNISILTPNPFSLRLYAFMYNRQTCSLYNTCTQETPLNII